MMSQKLKLHNAEKKYTRPKLGVHETSNIFIYETIFARTLENVCLLKIHGIWNLSKSGLAGMSNAIFFFLTSRHRTANALTEHHTKTTYTDTN
jgi:hypothetical protein